MARMFELPGRSPGVQFALGMDQLDQALDTLAEVDFSEVDGHCLGQRLLELLGHSRRLGAVRAMVADRFSASGVWGDAGAKSARAWIASQSNEPAGRVAAMLNTGKGMRWHEQMAQAFTAGEVSARHLDILAAAGAKYPQLRGMLYEHAEVIVEVARYATPARFAQELEAICHRFDPAAVDADGRKRDSEAYVHLSPIGDGMWRLDGLLPAEVGTQFAAVLDAARRRLRAEARDHERINGDLSVTPRVSLRGKPVQTETILIRFPSQTPTRKSSGSMCWAIRSMPTKPPSKPATTDLAPDRTSTRCA